MHRPSVLFLLWAFVLLVGGGMLGLAEEPSAIDLAIAPMSVVASDSLRYALSEEGVFLCSTDRGATWEERHQGLPERKVYPHHTMVKRPLTAIGVDIHNPSRVAVTTASAMYLSEDYGMTWQRVPVRLPGGAYITAVAISPWEKGRYLLGTGFSGVFETRNAGANWNLAVQDRRFNQGAGFKEEVAGLAFHPHEKDSFFLVSGFGQGIYQVNDRGLITEVSLGGVEKGAIIRSIAVTPPSDGIDAWQLSLSSKEMNWRYRIEDLTLATMEARNTRTNHDPQREYRRAKASDRFGIYLQPHQCKGQRFQSHLQFLKKHNLNSIVVDFKDDLGNLTYDSGLAMAREVGAVRPSFSAKTLLAEAKKNNLYVIARLVVFKDARLYAFQQNRFATWDGTTDRPWGNMIETESGGMVPKEYWVDPYAPEVWEYNLAIAEELQSLGVDEIQFDYIRFPTDGPVSRIRYRHRQEGMEKIDALESFLAQAREKLQIPISTDLYGFNCWYRMEGWTGQNLQRFADYVDVICPMFYPSHFPSSFMKGVPYLERAHRIYYEGVLRAAEITDNRCVIRPYVQAFLLGGERKMNETTYRNYLMQQVDGLVTADPRAGFTLWNNSNKYYMVGSGLKDMLEAIQPPEINSLIIQTDM